MSIYSEIERIKAAKNNIINVLKKNNIQIEEDAKIDEINVAINDAPILDTSDATATADDIVDGKTAYINGQKVIGALEVGPKINNQDKTVTENGTVTADEGYTGLGTVTVNVPSTTPTPDNTFADAAAKMYTELQTAYNNMEPRVLTDNNKTIDKNIYFIPVKPDGVPLLDTSNVTSMACMFKRCNNLTSIPLLDTSNVTSMLEMFYECNNLTAIPLLNTSKVTNMKYMFCNCNNLTAIPLLDTSEVTDMSDMFYGCNNLTTIPLLDTSNVTRITEMFCKCNNLTSIPLLDTSNVMYMSNMFKSCNNLTSIPLLDTSNVTDMNSTFYECNNLTTIPLLNTSKVTNMPSMFFGCNNLTTIPLLDISKVTNMIQMFWNCINLVTIPLLDTSNVTYMGNAYYNCRSLSEESLNNILEMCANASKITSNKTLQSIGLTITQVITCKTLSNYEAFINAGWSTGY